MVRKSVSAVDMVNIPFCCEGYFYIPGWPLEPQGWLPPIEWNIFAKRLGSSHKTEVQMAWHLHWGFFHSSSIWCFKVCNLFSNCAPSFRILMSHRKELLYPSSVTPYFCVEKPSGILCTLQMWKGGGGVERDWRGDQYPGSGCGPLGAKKTVEDGWKKRDTTWWLAPVFFLHQDVTYSSNKHIWSREMPTFQRPHRFIPSPQEAVWLWRVFFGQMLGWVLFSIRAVPLFVFSLHCRDMRTFA